MKESLEGILHLFSETGTEGGLWTFQESKYIKENVPQGYCRKCGTYMKKQSGPLKVKNITTLDEEIMKEYKHSGEINFKPTCADNNHEELISSGWDLKGLHILKNGDKLTIYRPENKDKLTIHHPENNKEVWSGVIDLKYCDPSSNFVLGWRVHTDQKGIERKTWANYFLESYPAKLMPLKENR